MFDSQRPIHHNNVLTQNAVYVVDFGDINVTECPEDKDREAAMEEANEAEGGDDIVDGEKEYQLIINGGKNTDQNDDAEGDEEDKDDDDFDTDLIGKKRKRDHDSPKAGNDRLRRIKRFNEYYTGSHYSKSCAYLTYSLGVQLNKQSVDSFWLWIMGLTDQLIHSKITSTQYDEELIECQKEFMSISKQNFNQENDNLKGNENDEISTKKFDAKGLIYAQ